MIVYEIVSEWDFGWENTLFTNSHSALEYIRNDLNFIEFLKDESFSFSSLEEVMDNGLIYLQEKEIFQ